MEISAYNGACGSDFGRACIGIKNKSQTIDVQIVVKKLPRQAELTK